MTLKDKTKSNYSLTGNVAVQPVEHNALLQNNEIECVVSNTLHRLLKFYRNHISLEEKRQLTVVPLKGRLDYKTSTVIMEKEEGLLNFLELPLALQLLVFSYLDVHSLCRVSQTCQTLRNLSNDSLLWEKILSRDLQKWTVINHQTLPKTYHDARADLTAKEIYARCSSACQQQWYQKPDSLTTRFLKFARPYFYDKPPTRVVMFGPGLESKTSSVVQQLLWGKISPFQVAGMFPGQQDGIGSGVSLKYNDELINLIILYSSTKKEREAALQAGMTQKNRILLNKKLEIEKEGSLVIEVTHPVRQLCKTIDAFIFAVDSSANKETVTETSNVLRSMMDERWTNQKAPLLVLSCAPAAAEPHHSCADIAEALQLYNMSRHWQINSAVVDPLEGLKMGTDWLLKQCSS